MFKKAIYISVASMLFLFSCKKKDDVGIQASYSGAKMVSFSNYDGYQQISIPVKDSFIAIEYEVKLANTTSTANGPITVKLIKDDNAIYEYNTLNSTSYSPIPVGSYKFEQTDVVIPKGARSAKVHFEVNPVKLVSVSSPTFGISIFSVSGDGAIVHTDNSQTHLIVEIIALNQWDGNYKSSNGYFYHPTAPRAIPAGTDKHCSTSGANSVVTELGDFNGVVQGATVYYVTLTIDGNNNVTIGPGPGAAPAASPVVTLPTLPAPYTPFTGSTPSIYTNKWDPNAKKFYLRYGYMGTNGYRVVEEVLAKQ